MQKLGRSSGKKIWAVLRCSSAHAFVYLPYIVRKSRCAFAPMSRIISLPTASAANRHLQKCHLAPTYSSECASHPGSVLLRFNRLCMERFQRFWFLVPTGRSGERTFSASLCSFKSVVRSGVPVSVHEAGFQQFRFCFL